MMGTQSDQRLHSGRENSPEQTWTNAVESIRFICLITANDALCHCTFYIPVLKCRAHSAGAYYFILEEVAVLLTL